MESLAGQVSQMNLAERMAGAASSGTPTPLLTTPATFVSKSHSQYSMAHSRPYPVVTAESHGMRTIPQALPSQPIGTCTCRNSCPGFAHFSFGTAHLIFHVHVYTLKLLLIAATNFSEKPRNR